MVLDYSKFDKIDISDDEDDEVDMRKKEQQQQAQQLQAQQQLQQQQQQLQLQQHASSSSSSAAHVDPALLAQTLPQNFEKTPVNEKDKKRKQFKHQDRVVYEWDQTIDEVNIYVELPPGVTAKHLKVEIKPNHLSVGIAGNPPYLSEALFDVCKAKESYWTVEDKELHITLSKMSKAQPWDSALKGHGVLDVLSQQEVKKDIMLERFQEENPGFDFSGAEFNGAIPDPRTFMGGMRST